MVYLQISDKNASIIFNTLNTYEQLQLFMFDCGEMRNIAKP